MHYRNDSPEMRRTADVLCPLGFKRRYEVRVKGKAYRIAFAHPRKRLAVLVGRPNARRTRELRAGGWKLVRL